MKNREITKLLATVETSKWQERFIEAQADVLSRWAYNSYKEIGRGMLNIHTDWCEELIIPGIMPDAYYLTPLVGDHGMVSKVIDSYDPEEEFILVFMRPPLKEAFLSQTKLTLLPQAEYEKKYPLAYAIERAAQTENRLRGGINKRFFRCYIDKKINEIVSLQDLLVIENREWQLMFIETQEEFLSRCAYDAYKKEGRGILYIDLNLYKNLSVLKLNMNKLRYATEEQILNAFRTDEHYGSYKSMIESINIYDPEKEYLILFQRHPDKGKKTMFRLLKRNLKLISPDFNLKEEQEHLKTNH